MIISSLISVLEVLLVTVPALLVVAFVTVAERKTMASMQRRLGPNLVGYYGLLQAFADALKLLLKEYISPTQSNFILFFLGPVITLVFSLLSFAVIPYASGLTILDLDLGILYLLAVSSLATYGILLAGWSANSKYAFLGSLRSTAQLISYELILSSAILIVILLTGSLNLTYIVESQRAIWFIFPLFPIFIIFFIACIAETNRAPFDLAEAESELVSGFMTEHSSVIFVFFFLAEYASIVVICILTTILFLGGYTLPGIVSNDINTSLLSYNILEVTSYTICYYIIDAINYLNFLISLSIPPFFVYFGWYLINRPKESNIADYKFSTSFQSLFKYLTYIYLIILSVLLLEYMVWYYSNRDEFVLFWSKVFISVWDMDLGLFRENIRTLPFYIDPSYCGLLFHATPSVILGIKTSLMIFVFIWARASLPRIRFDQLMSFCWTVLLPLVVAFIIIVPCILYGFDILPTSIIL